MVKSKPNNRAMGARGARPGPRKNIQKQNQNASKPRRGRRNRARANENDTRGMGASFGGMPKSSVGVNYGGKIIERDELIQSINGSVSFATTKFSVNPGLAATFPGLSKDAANYEEWRCISSVFYVKPLVSAFSTQGQTGETIISFDPNALGAAPTTQAQAEFFWHNQAAPYEEFELNLPAARMNRADAKYLRSGAAPAGSDLKTYDGGNVYVSTYGQGGTAACCELRHKSRFMVFAPTLLLGTAGSGMSGLTSAFFQSTTAESAGATTVAKTLALATATANGLGIVNTAGSFVPPAGTFLINASVTAANSAGQSTDTVLDIRKNGTTVFTSAVLPQSGNAIYYMGNTSVSASAVVTCNGTTDAITFVVTDSYSSGTTTNSGLVTFLST
jgi:hypothetical protein